MDGHTKIWPQVVTAHLLSDNLSLLLLLLRQGALPECIEVCRCRANTLPLPWPL